MYALVRRGTLTLCTHHSSPEDQLTRMLSRDGPSGLTEADANSRLRAQLPLTDKLAYADVILENSSGTEHGDTSAALKAQVEALVQRWHAKSHSFTGRLGWLGCWLLPPVGLLVGFITARLRWSAVARRKRSPKSVEEAIRERGVVRSKKE